MDPYIAQVPSTGTEVRQCPRVGVSGVHNAPTTAKVIWSRAAAKSGLIRQTGGAWDSGDQWCCTRLKTCALVMDFTGRKREGPRSVSIVNAPSR